VFPVVLPPLRERREDIPRLIQHFAHKFARRMGRSIESIPTEAMEALVEYPWPGNVRELQNIIERAVILSRGNVLQVPVGELKAAIPPSDGSPFTAGTLADSEREHILNALKETNWVVSGPNGAAARLGVKRSNLQWKMKRLGVVRPR
jgi:formate hydrogenlyase transcriptional activator